MPRLGRSQPAQPRLITPPAPPPSSVISDGRITAAGQKTATGSAVITATGKLAPAGGTHTGSGSANITGTGVLTPSASPPPLRAAWTAAYTAPAQPAGVPLPGPASIPVSVANTAGDWLFAVVAWRQAPGYPPVTFSVGDGVNHWEPMGAPGGTSPATLPSPAQSGIVPGPDPSGTPAPAPPPATVRVAIWRAAAARAVSVVAAAPTGFVPSAAVAVIEVTGLQPWIAEAGTVTAYGAGTQALPALQPPGSQVPVWWLTACARSLSSPAGIYPASPVTIPFSGVPGEAAPGQATPADPSIPSIPFITSSVWQPGPEAAAGNGTDHTGDLVLLTAFQQAQGNVSAAWSQTAASDMAAIAAGVQVSAAAPAQPNPGWAPGVFEIAPGAGPGTPADEITWIPVDGAGGVPVRMQDLSFTQGQQYTVGSLQAGQGSVTIDNRDLAATPPGTGAFTGIDSGIPWRYRAVWPGGGSYPANPTPHYVLSGYTADLPSTWKTTRRGIIQAGLTDAWAYCQPQLKSALRQEMLADNPAHLWPCSDAAGTLYASNLAPGSTAMLVQVISKYGDDGGTAGFGAQASLSAAQAAVAPGAGGGLPGGGGTVWGQSGLPSAPSDGGYCLYCEDSRFPPLSGAAGMSVECWTAFTDPVLQQNATLWAVKGTRGVILRVWADVTGALWLTYTSRSAFPGTPVTVSLGTSSFTGAGLFQTVVTYLSGTGLTAWVNGTQVLQVAAAGLPDRFSWITAGGEADRFTTGGMFDGQTCFLAVFPVALQPSRVAAHWQAGTAAFTGEPDHSRAERLLTYASYTGRRVIKRAATPDLTSSLAHLGTTSASAGTGAPTPAGIGTVQAGQEITALVASLTPAMMYVSPPGDIVWQPKALQYAQPAVWLLGDSGPPAIPFQWDVSWGWDPQRVLNDIQITQADRQDIVTPQAFVPLAPGYTAPGVTRGKYGQQTYQITGYLYNDLTTPLSSSSPASLLDLANWISVTLAAPHLRVGKVTVDAATYPAAWPLVLSACAGDIALVGQAPVTASSSISLLARIMRVERRIAWIKGSPVATAALTLDYAPELTPVILDDPVAGQLDGTRVLPW